MTITKRGSTYHFDAVLGNKRVRCSLGVSDPKAASRLANRVQFALSDGPRSSVWSELRTALPVSSFKRLTQGVLPADPLKLTELEQKFLDHNLRREQLGQLGTQARKNYDRTTKLFFDRALEAGLTKVEDLTPEFVESHLLWRKESIIAKGGSGRGLATDGVVLSALFEFAVEEGWLAKSPLKYRPKVPSVEEAVQPFTDEEMAALAAVEKSELEKELFAVLKFTGLRCGDVADLLWSAFDFKTWTLRWRTKKRGKVVEIPLGPDMYAALCPRWRIADPGRVFPTLTPAKIYQIVQRWGDEAEVENCHPHRFRHSFVCRLLGRHGLSLFDVAQLIGDTTAVCEKHYAKWTSGQEKRIRGIMNLEGS